MKTSEQRANFPEFTDEQFRVYKQDLGTLVWEGQITLEEHDSVLAGEISLMEILDRKGL